MNELSARERGLLTEATEDESKLWLYRSRVILALVASACSVGVLIIAAIGILDVESGRVRFWMIIINLLISFFMAFQLGHFMFRKHVFSLIRKLRKMVPDNVEMPYNQPRQHTNGS